MTLADRYAPLSTAAAPPSDNATALVGAVMLAAFFWLLIHVLAVAGAFDAIDRPAAAGSTLAGLAAAVAVSTLVGLAYMRALRGGWGSVVAAGLVLLPLAHPTVLNIVTVAPHWLPLLSVCGVLVLAIQRVADVGDVQSQIGLGLALSLTPFGGPLMTPLILPIAIAGALTDIDGRRNLKAFLSLLLVLVIPCIVTITAIELLSGVSVLKQHLTQVNAVGQGLLNLGQAGLPPGPALRAAMPGLVLVLGLVLAATRHPTRAVIATAGVALVLPLYLELCRESAGVAMPTWLPMAALLVTSSAASLALPAAGRRRGLVLAVLIASAAFAWRAPGPTDDKVWTQAVLAPLSLLTASVWEAGQSTTDGISAR